jgi:hypothetical protein
VIILEGPDNAGKTTLLSQLLEMDPSLRVLKRQRFKPEMGQTIGTSYLEALMPPPDGDRLAHANSICDRFLASECIYGALYRGSCRMTPREHFLIKTILLSYGAFVVHCNPPLDVILKTWDNREQLYNQDPGAIHHAYRTRIRKIFFPIPVLTYDYTAEGAEIQRRAILERHAQTLRQYRLELGWRVTACDDLTPHLLSRG